MKSAQEGAMSKIRKKYENVLKATQDSQLSSIPEDTKMRDQGDVFEQLKAKKAGQAAAGGGSAAQGRTYQFNQRAYKKYHSTKSLVERILKSHSEGNRFIRNEDL